ncbi:MAG: fimbrillin family protein [Alistipes sp.]|nr:fimbrillin family protein [Alistipes sp.]
MRKFSIIAIALWAVAACSKEEPAVPTGAHEIRIAAEIGQTENPSAKAQCLTRATETAFEYGDQIGLRVEYASALVGHRNACLTHNGRIFTGRRIMWTETEGAAVLSAYYPYDAKNADVPTTFAVPQNQRTDAAFASADFLAASRSVTVAEFAEPVHLQFRHVLSKVIINMTDETEAKDVIDHLSIQNLKTVAAIDYANREASVSFDAVMPQNMTSHRVDDLKHEIILVPQQAGEMKIEVYTESNEGVALRFTKYLVKNVELKSGYRYKLNITLKDGEGEEVIEFDTAVAEVKPWDENESELEGQV